MAGQPMNTMDAVAISVTGVVTATLIIRIPVNGLSHFSLIPHISRTNHLMGAQMGVWMPPIIN